MVSEITKSEDFDNPTKTPTEMILHMKGPMYSVAERKISTANSAATLKNGAYSTQLSGNKFFRKPIHEYTKEFNLSKVKTH